VELKPAPCDLFIVLYLFYEQLKAVELQFGSYEFQKLYLDIFIVEVSVKIEVIDFVFHLFSNLHGRSEPYV